MLIQNHEKYKFFDEFERYQAAMCTLSQHPILRAEMDRYTSWMFQRMVEKEAGTSIKRPKRAL